MQIVISNGHVRGVTSWTTGFRPIVHRKPRRTWSDDQLQEMALEIERDRGSEAALDFLDEHLQKVGQPVMTH